MRSPTAAVPIQQPMSSNPPSESVEITHATRSALAARAASVNISTLYTPASVDRQLHFDADVMMIRRCADNDLAVIESIVNGADADRFIG